MGRVKLVVCDDMMLRRESLGLNTNDCRAAPEVLVIDDCSIVYDCGGRENCQALFIQSKYLAKMVETDGRLVDLGVFFDTNIPPSILRATTKIEFRPLSPTIANERKKLRSVYRRFHLCMIFGSFEEFEAAIHTDAIYTVDYKH